MNSRTNENRTGESVTFEFELYRVNLAEPRVTRSGKGTIIDRGLTLDGYCDAMAVRVCVVESPD